MSKSDTDQGKEEERGYVGMKKEEAVVFLRNHGYQAMIENGVVMIIMAQSGSTIKKIGSGHEQKKVSSESCRNPNFQKLFITP